MSRSRLVKAKAELDLLKAGADYDKMEPALRGLQV